MIWLSYPGGVEGAAGPTGSTIFHFATALTQASSTVGLLWHTFTLGSPYPRPDGTVGPEEIGIDITGDEPKLVVGATPIYDIMSYHVGPPKNWTSVYTYLTLMTAISGIAPPARQTVHPGGVLR